MGEKRYEPKSRAVYGQESIPDSLSRHVRLKKIKIQQFQTILEQYLPVFNVVLQILAIKAYLTLIKSSFSWIRNLKPKTLISTLS